jgi:hypothetical protein
MINHARTILLNQAPNKTHYSDPGYAYIPPSFAPIKLSATLENIHRLIFGSRPDNYFLNFRARELLNYLHTTELSEFVYALDPRVTYWPEPENPFLFPATERILITQIFGGAQSLTVTGDLAPNHAVGRASSQYKVILRGESESLLQLKVQEFGKTVKSTTLSADVAQNAAVLTIPQTEIKLRVDLKNSPEIEAGELVAQWLIETKINPAPTITHVLPTLEKLGEPAYLELFGLRDEEPYLTFKNLWFDHPMPVYKFGGLVLAWIYRAETLRGKNG